MGMKWMVAAAALSAVVTGCSFSIGDTATNAAEDLIEGDLADEIGLTDLTADCEVPSSSDVGSIFSCTSPSEIGEIKWQVTIAEDDIVNVTSTNLIDEDDLDSLETAAVEVIESETGAVLGPENFSCGVAPVALAVDSILLCDLTDPINGDIYDAELKITDFDTGAFDVEVADSPR